MTSHTDEAPVYDQPSSEPSHVVEARNGLLIPFEFSSDQVEDALKVLSTQQLHPSVGSGNNMTTWSCRVAKLSPEAMRVWLD